MPAPDIVGKASIEVVDIVHESYSLPLTLNWRDVNQNGGRELARIHDSTKAVWYWL
ncbi:hypothetical protein D3C85_946180 [compost metagenome]